MIIFFTVGILILGIVLFLCTNQYSVYNTISAVAIIYGAVSCLIIGISLPFNHLDINSEIQEFKSVKASITEARSKLDIESAAIYVKIIDANKWLTKKQYWNSTVFDLWIPDEVDELKLIK